MLATPFPGRVDGALAGMLHCAKVLYLMVKVLMYESSIRSCAEGTGSRPA